MTTSKIVKKTKFFTVSLTMLSLIATSCSGFLYAVPKAQAADPTIITALEFAGKKATVIDGTIAYLNLYGVLFADLSSDANITISKADSDLVISDINNESISGIPSIPLPNISNDFPGAYINGFISNATDATEWSLVAANVPTLNIKGTLDGTLISIIIDLTNDVDKPFVKNLSFAGETGSVNGDVISLNLSAISESDLKKAASIEVSEVSTITIPAFPAMPGFSLRRGVNDFSADMMNAIITNSRLEISDLKSNANSEGIVIVPLKLADVSGNSKNLEINILITVVAPPVNVPPVVTPPADQGGNNDNGKHHKSAAERKKEERKRAKKHNGKKDKKVSQVTVQKKIAEFGVFATPQHQFNFRTVSAIKNTNPARFAAMMKAFKKYNTVSAKVFVKPSAAINMFRSYEGYSRYLNYTAKLKK